MYIEEVVRKTNVSTIFLLPIFTDIAEGITYKLTSVPFNLIPLFYEYGMLKTFCYSYLSKDNNSLFLVFDKTMVTKKMSNTNKPNQTLNNLIIGSKYFSGLDIVNDLCIYNLAIPPEYFDDVSLIKKGMYSKVSKEFADKLLVKIVINKGLLKNEIAYKITQQNIGFAVCTKKPRIKEEFEKSFTVKDIFRIPDNVEYYEKFSNVKETLTPAKLEALVKR